MSVAVSPMNSVVLVGDRESGEVPEAMGFGVVAATGSCLAVGARAAVDGETTVRVAGRGEGELGGLSRAWAGVLATPSGVLVVSDVVGTELLALSVEPVVSVEVWVNDPREPDLIHVVVR
ncbi:hypothetical protein GCM10009804_35080 [Kribbella hippodromi]|uniref:Uncharacterized protein n=1 Tax=Kribbella hippodromi TaxID=434347 RepID=A0ABN2DG75_9ACTN